MEESQEKELNEIEGKQSIRHRVQNNGYEDAQGTLWELPELSGNYISMINDIETMNKNQEDIKNTISEIKNSLEGIKSSLDEAEDQISELEGKVEKTIQSEQQNEKKTKKKK